MKKDLQEIIMSKFSFRNNQSSIHKLIHGKEFQDFGCARNFVVPQKREH